MSPPPLKTDVFISGAGPVGLILHYQLLRLGIATHIIDAADKASPAFPMLGRASTLFPRSLEMLDQLELYAPMAQQGVVGRRAITYDSEGKRVHGRGWTMLESTPGTYFDFMLNLRLKYIEGIMRGLNGGLGGRVEVPVRLVGLEVDEGEREEYKIRATCERVGGERYEVRAKYIVGCDGGNSAVRKLAEIPFVGADKEDRWVRIDGVVKTDMPDSRVPFVALESKTHGNVLWASIDHGATRIGYVLNAEMYAKYGQKMSKEDAVKEAKAAVAPFSLEFETVEWHTVYTVKQHVAERLQDRERVLLAGDAAHVHSSGTAQGLNTGTHDTVGLGWRLAGVLNDWYKPEVLATYTEERKAAADTLIENDKIISALISQHKPGKFKDRPEDPNTLLAEFLSSSTVTAFANGLGIHYSPNILNDVQGSSPPSPPPGHRAPDVLIRKNGFSQFPIRLFDVTKNVGKFHVLVFTGDVNTTRRSLKTLRSQVDQLARPLDHAISFRTIAFGHGIVFAEYLGVEQFGDAYWDIDQSAHVGYKVSPDQGAIVVLRPDGITGFVAPLDGFDRVAQYFGRLIVPREVEAVTNGVNGHVGELISLDENNLYYQEAKEQARQQALPSSTESGVVPVR